MRHHKEVRKQTLMSFFVSINYLGRLGQEGSIRFFLLGFLQISKEMVTNMKLAFTNVLFRHNSACVIQKWLTLKRIITVTLSYIS